MAAIAKVGRTGNQDVNGLLTGVRWADSSLTYSFPAAARFYGQGYGEGEPRDNFDPLTHDQEVAAKFALRAYAAVANFQFREVTETASKHGLLRFAQSDEHATAYGYYPARTREGGDTWYNNSSGAYDHPERGNYARHTFLHEIGHALGLKHGQEKDVYGAMTRAHDSMEFSVMTYRSYVGDRSDEYDNETWGYAQSPMMYDIAALQHMYGANYGTRAGDTVYRWNPATGEMSVNGDGQGAPGGNRVFLTVWDGGGRDAYDLSNYATGVAVDLRPGRWTTLSDVQLTNLGDGHMARGNVANALLHRGNARSLIEDAEGGAGHDRLVGNQAGNRLSGNAGNDRLNGLGGNDRLNGLGGNDMLAGGTGNDRASGGAGNDRLSGGTGSDRLSGNAGNDFLDGGSGADTLAGGAGVDRFVFGPGTVESAVDTIVDFSRPQGDRIVLAGIDADAGAAGNQAFDFIGRHGFNGDAGELRFRLAGGDATVYGDVDGDGRADFSIRVLDVAGLKAADFDL